MEPVNTGPADASASLTSTSAEKTHAFGVALGSLLEPGDFIGLVGALGAGKTHFVRGVAQGAGVAPSEVSSPTFAIVNSYQGRFPLFHADLYRLQGYDELYSTGLLDLISPEGAVIVEWLDRVWRAAPSDRLVLHFEYLVEGDPQRRSIRAEAHGKRSARLLEQWRVLCA